MTITLGDYAYTRYTESSSFLGFYNLTFEPFNEMSKSKEK